MPSFKHSKLSKIKIDVITTPSPIATTLTDISAYCDNVDMPEDLELVETTTFGSTSKTYLVGFADGKLNLSGNWDPTLAGILGALKAAFRDGDLDSVTFEYGPEGADSGDHKYTGEAVLVSFNKTSESKSQVKFSAEFQITGPVAETTFA
jgi:hypothetical protein